MGFVIAEAWGTPGDVLPYVAIGAELRKRGHEVTLISNPAFARLAQEAALSFVPVGTAEQQRALIEDPGTWDHNTYESTAVKQLLPTVAGFYEAVLRTHRPGETVLLVSRPGGWIAREKLDIPSVAFLLSPGGLSRLDPNHPSRPLPVWANAIARSRWGLRLLHGLRSQGQRMVGALRGERPISGSVGSLLAEIQRVRALAGLAEHPPSPEATRPELVICLWPSWFSPPQKDWPPGTKTSGFPFYPTPSGRNRNPRPGDDASRPIVFTRGSAASHQRPFFEAAVQCCHLLERPGVLVTPHADDVPTELPSTVRHVPFADFGELFATAAAVVHHGGIGTIAHAFAAGIPQVIMPIVGDQFDLGYRMERLGVGSMLTQAPLTAARLARELRSLCASKRTRRLCNYFRDKVDLEAGCSLAADWIELVARHSRAKGRA